MCEKLAGLFPRRGGNTEENYANYKAQDIKDEFHTIYR